MAWNKTKVPETELVESFASELGLYELARSFRTSPNTLRRVWEDAYGKEPVLDRARAHWKSTGEIAGKRGAGKPKAKTMTEIICGECGNTFTVSRMSKAKFQDPKCSECKNKRLDRSCPICGVLVDGAKGLSLHYRHWSADPAHSSALNISVEDLTQFLTKSGKVMIGRAMFGLGRGAKAIKDAARKYHMPTYGRYVSQGQCLAAVAKALAVPSSEVLQEWILPGDKNKYRFDGYLPSHNLVVEFHGYQHWTFPSVYFKTREDFEALQRRDSAKIAMIEAQSHLKYLVIREDEPFTDVIYIRDRLIALGVLHG
jgi:hypothetical protein